MDAATEGDRSLWKRFVRWQLLLGVFHVVGSIVVAYTVAKHGDWDVPVHITFSSWRRLGNITNGSTVTAVVVENRVPVESRVELRRRLPLGVVVSFFSLFSAANHFATYATSDNLAHRYIKEGVNRFRWADYAMSSSLMLMVNSVLFVSPPDFVTLILWFTVQFLVIMGGYGSEVAWAAGNREDAFAIFIAAAVAYSAVWVAPWAQFAAAVSGDDSATAVGNCSGAMMNPASSDPPVLVYILLAWLCGTFFLFPLVHLWKINTTHTPVLNQNLRFEVAYSFLSLVAKIPLMLTFASGVTARGQRESGDDGGRGAQVTLGVSSACCLVVGFFLALDLIVLDVGLVRFVRDGCRGSRGGRAGTKGARKR
tara:strand:+ start:2452 stop:3552 length:1101 start_codon:yes stop_codon:yes gene_type:complete